MGGHTALCTVVYNQVINEFLWEFYENNLAPAIITKKSSSTNLQGRRISWPVLHLYAVCVHSTSMPRAFLPTPYFSWSNVLVDQAQVSKKVLWHPGRGASEYGEEELQWFWSLANTRGPESFPMSCKLRIAAEVNILGSYLNFKSLIICFGSTSSVLKMTLSSPTVEMQGKEVLQALKLIKEADWKSRVQEGYCWSPTCRM